MEGPNLCPVSSAAFPTGPSPRAGSLSLSPPTSYAGCRFGGGPAVNHLYVCSICQVEIEALAKRRRIEIDTFIKVHAGGVVGVPGPPASAKDAWGLKSHAQSGSVLKACSGRGQSGQRPRQTARVVLAGGLGLVRSPPSAWVLVSGG